LNIADLQNMILDLSNHKRRRDDVIEQCVAERLNKSLRVYFRDLTDAASSLEYRDNIRVARALNRGEQYD
jgi:hypothetical protein